MFTVLGIQFLLQFSFGGGVQLGAFLFQLIPGCLQVPRSIRLRLVQFFHAREMFTVMGIQFSLKLFFGGRTQPDAFLFQLIPGCLQLPRSIRLRLVQFFHAREIFVNLGFQFMLPLFFGIQSLHTVGFKLQSFRFQMCRMHVKFLHATRALHPAPFFHLIQFFHATRVLHPPLFFLLVLFLQPLLAFGIKVLLGRFQLCGFILFKFFHAGQKMQHVFLFALNTRFFFVRKRVFQGRSGGFQFRSFGGNGFGTPRVQAAFHRDGFNEIRLALG